MLKVILTNAEMHLAASVGMRRHIEALERKLPDKHGHYGAGWNLHIEGALGELAVAKALGRHWGGTVNSFKRGGDVGELQVRTRSLHEYELIIREDDQDEDMFVLVTGIAPKFLIRGWRKAGEVKLPEYWKTVGGRPGAYFVPASVLWPLRNEMLKGEYTILEKLNGEQA